MFKKLTKQEYRDLFKKALFSTFFHNPEWQKFLEKEFKWLKFKHYLYKDEALLSFGKIGKKLISLPFCEYGGPLPLKHGIDFAAFVNDTLKEFGNNIKIKFHPQVLNFFITSNFEPQTSNIATYWIENLDKLPKEELLASFRKTLRHSIRDAEQQGIKIKKCSDISELKQFYNLYLNNLKIKKTVPYPFSIIEFLYHNSNVEILLAWYKKKIVGGSLFLRYNDFVHYFLSASDYKYRNLGASYLILWTKIKSLCGQDKICDLGASPRGSSLEIFKRGWGGKEYPILQIGIKRSEESLRSSKLRNIWGILPNFVIKIISRYFIKYRI